MLKAHHLVILWTITIAIFVLLAWRSEVNRAHIDRTSTRLAVNTWDLCEKIRANTIVIAKTAGGKPLDIPDCGPRP